MSLVEQALSYVRAISPYQPGKPITELAREMGIPVEKIVKLASNENPLGMSPKARKAVEAAINGIERYPDQFDVDQSRRSALQRGAEPDRPRQRFQRRARPGRPRFPGARSLRSFCPACLCRLSAGHAVDRRRADRDAGQAITATTCTAMRAAIRPDTRIVWIANPNNPTGTFLPYPEVRAFLEAVPKDVVVVLDEAYNEYLPPTERVDTAAWIADFPNLVITRTFSKIFGLAGLRVGYALASAEIADLMNRVRQPFNVNNLAIAAAIAALDDHLFVAESYELNRRGMEQIVAGLKRLGLEHIPSHGNFVTFKAGDGAAVNQKLLKQGVIVRPIGGYGLPEWLRVTIGTEPDNTPLSRSPGESALNG